MWELDCEESWEPKNWYFRTVVLEKTLESPLDCKELQPVHSKGDQPWVYFGRMMLKLKLQYFGHLMRRVDSLEKTLMLGGIGAGGEGDARGWDGWMASRTRWTWVWANSGSWWWTGRPGVLQFMGSQRVEHNWVTELNWTELVEHWHQFSPSLMIGLLSFCWAHDNSLPCSLVRLCAHHLVNSCVLFLGLFLPGYVHEFPWNIPPSHWLGWQKLQWLPFSQRWKLDLEGYKANLPTHIISLWTISKKAQIPILFN